jgi:hypothetical protein
MEISWIDRVTNEEVLKRVKEEINVIQRIKRKKADWIGHLLRRNCLLKHFIEGNKEIMIEVTGRQRRRSKQLLCDLKENRRILEVERGSTRSHSVENSLWKKVYICHKADNIMNEYHRSISTLCICVLS